MPNRRFFTCNDLAVTVAFWAETRCRKFSLNKEKLSFLTGNSKHLGNSADPTAVEGQIGQGIGQKMKLEIKVAGHGRSYPLALDAFAP